MYRGSMPQIPTAYGALFSELRLDSRERAPSRAGPGSEALTLRISSWRWNAA